MLIEPFRFAMPIEEQDRNYEMVQMLLDVLRGRNMTDQVVTSRSLPHCVPY